MRGHAALRQLLEDFTILFFFRRGATRLTAPVRMGLGALVVLAAAQTTGMLGSFETPDTRHCCQHGDVALHMALADTYCGLKNRVFQPSEDVFRNLDDETARMPLADYITRATGAADLKAACAAAAPYSNFHEYSVSALMKAAIALPPKDTPLSLMEKMRAVILTMAIIGGALAAFCRIGIVPLYAAYGVALGLTRTLEPYAWSDYYYYLPVLLLFMVSVAATFSVLLVRARLWVFAAFALFAGVALDLTVNLRTSYGVAFGVGLLISAAAGLLTLALTKAPIRRIAFCFAAAAAAFVASTAANRVMFSSFRAADVGSEVEYHLFWHPVVLGLAVPGTDFTKAEGIRWSDSVGVELAKRIDPQAGSDGLRYEAALKSYYVSLWREHPKEMIGVYLTKLRTFGGEHARILYLHEISKFLERSNLHGAPLLLLVGLSFLFTTYVGFRRGVPEFALFAGAAAIFLVMMQMELVLIYSQFAYTHNGSSLALFVLFGWCVGLAAALFAYDKIKGLARGL